MWKRSGETVRQRPASARPGAWRALPRRSVAGAAVARSASAPPPPALRRQAPVLLVDRGRVREEGRRAVAAAQRVLVRHGVEVGLVGDAAGARLEEAVHVVDVDRVVRLRRRHGALEPDAPLADAEPLAVALRDLQPGAEPPGPPVERDVVVLVPSGLR